MGDEMSGKDKLLAQAGAAEEEDAKEGGERASTNHALISGTPLTPAIASPDPSPRSATWTATT